MQIANYMDMKQPHLFPLLNGALPTFRCMLTGVQHCGRLPSGLKALATTHRLLQATQCVTLNLRSRKGMYLIRFVAHRVCVCIYFVTTCVRDSTFRNNANSTLLGTLLASIPALPITCRPLENDHSRQLLNALLFNCMLLTSKRAPI